MGSLRPALPPKIDPTLFGLARFTWANVLTARRRKALSQNIIVGAVWLAYQDPPDSTGARGACGRGISIWGISRALDGQNTVSELLLLGTMATKGVPTGD